MFYSTDSIAIPDIENSQALGEDYLGDGVTNYSVLFSSSGGGGGPIGVVPNTEGS